MHVQIRLNAWVMIFVRLVVVCIFVYLRVLLLFFVIVFVYIDNEGCAGMMVIANNVNVVNITCLVLFDMCIVLLCDVIYTF